MSPHKLIQAVNKAINLQDITAIRPRQGGGFECDTSAGSSRETQIYGATEAEVAINYLNHIKAVYRYILDKDKPPPIKRDRMLAALARMESFMPKPD